MLGSGALIIAIETVCLSASRVVDMLSSTALNSLERCQCGMLKCWCFKEGSQHTCWAHWIFCKLAGSRLKPSGNAKLQLARDSGPMVSMRLCCRGVFPFYGNIESTPSPRAHLSSFAFTACSINVHLSSFAFTTCSINVH